MQNRIAGAEGVAGRLVRTLLAQLLNLESNALSQEITTLVRPLAPTLLAAPGCAPLMPPRSSARPRHNGTTPLPVWTSNNTRHRLNAALHRIALTQARWHPPVRALMARRIASGDSGLAALRIPERRLLGVVYAALCEEKTTDTATPAA